MTLEEVLGMNVAQVIEHHGTDANFRDRVFLTFRDDDGELQQVTFGDYFERSVEYGALFSEMREEQGNPERFHVGTFMQNTPEFLYAFGGCALTGSTLVGINASQVGEGLAFDIRNIGLNVLVADNVVQEPKKSPNTFLENVLAVVGDGLGSLVYENILAREYNDAVVDVTTEIQSIQDEVDAFVPRNLNPESPGVIIFTSGTTGAPKGIEVSWSKLFDVGVTATNILGYTEDDVGYVCMPLNHSNSLYLNVMPALLHGASIFLRRRFSSSKFASDVSDNGCTIFNCVGDPVQYVLNVEGDADHSDSPLRAVISTGTNAVNRARITKMFGLETGFIEIYGSTEVGAVTAVDANTPDWSVGRLLKDVRILNENSGELCDLANIVEGRITNLSASAGEVIVSMESLGASAFSGYFNLPEKSAERLIEIDGKKFYRMGDLGAIADVGGVKYLNFLGRTGDWIRYKGENFAPVDVEKVLDGLVGVVNSAVIGVPQMEGKEDDPMYVLEVDEDFELANILDVCRESLAHYQQPRFVRVVESLPMTSTMKVQKSPLKREIYDPSVSGVVYEVTSDGFEVVSENRFREELALCKDSSNKDRLIAYTGREDLF